MKTQEWRTKDWIAMIVCGVLATIAILTIVPGWAVIGRLLSAEGAPAWVQAVGSVAAILIAIWVGEGPERAARKHTIINARAFASGVTSCARAMELSVDARQPRMVSLSRVSLDEMADIGRNIRTEHLPSTSIGALISLRSIAAQISAAAMAYEKRSTPAEAESLKTLLAYHGNLINLHTQKLANPH